jgi:hypothetical protein
MAGWRWAGWKVHSCVYYALCEQDFEQVAVINPAHAKALRCHKTDLLTEPRDVTAAQRTE